MDPVVKGRGLKEIHRFLMSLIPLFIPAILLPIIRTRFEKRVRCAELEHTQLSVISISAKQNILSLI